MQLPNRLLGLFCAGIFIYSNSFCTEAYAGFQIVGQLHPSDQSRGFAGLTFGPNFDPVVLDPDMWSLTTLSPTNASVISTTSITPSGGICAYLAYDQQTGNYYTSTQAPVQGSTESFLAMLNPTSHSSSLASFELGEAPNFGALSFDPSGTLWLSESASVNFATYNAINLNTGARTSTGGTMSFPAELPDITTGMEPSAIAFDAEGHLFADAVLSDGIERVFVATSRSSIALVTATGFGLSPNPGQDTYLTAMAYDAGTNQMYGIETVDKNTYYLGIITGIPEPSGSALAIAFIGAMLARRTRFQTAKHHG